MNETHLRSLSRLHIADVNDGAWDTFVDRHPHGHVLQTSGWAGLKARFGWSKLRVTVVDDAGLIIAGASILLRNAFGLRIAYAPRGPLTDWADVELTVLLMDAIQAQCTGHGAAVLKIEPGLIDTSSNRLLLERFCFAPSPQTVQPRSTIVVNIDDDEDAILQRMKTKWRYNIRLAERKDVRVRTAAAVDLPAINELMALTAMRDGFDVHSPEYYQAAYELLSPNHAAYLLAEYEGEALAAIVVAKSGESACYLWGASSNRERNRMPNHALQWAGMQWAKAHGARRYDLWGIPDELGIVASGMCKGDNGIVTADSLPVELATMPTDGLWGVFRFKQGFGGCVVRDVGAWDKSLNAFGSRAYRVGLALRDHTSDMRGRLQGLPNGGTKSRVAGTAVRSVETAIEWRTLLAQLPSPHVLQSWEWGEIKAQTGWHADRIGLFDEAGAGKAGFQFLWRAISDRLPFRIGYAPKGPVVDWTDSKSVDEVLSAIEALARRRRCIFVKIDPDVRSDLAEGVVLTAKLKRRGWRFSREQIQFQNTAFSELPNDDEALMAAMKTKWRYNVRLASKRGVTVREGSVDDLPAFYAMYAETGSRDGFLIRPYSYYRDAWQTMLQAQLDDDNPAGGALLLAEHEQDSEPIAGLFLMKYADRAWYFYGASTDRRRRDMPNHLLQWEALLWAREHGCTTYDWWGAPTNLDDAQDGLQGVWQFKQGFGAVFQPHVGAWDYVTNPALYAVYSKAIPVALDIMKRFRKSLS